MLAELKQKKKKFLLSLSYSHQLKQEMKLILNLILNSFLIGLDMCMFMLMMFIISFRKLRVTTLIAKPFYEKIGHHGVNHTLVAFPHNFGFYELMKVSNNGRISVLSVRKCDRHRLTDNDTITY